MRLSILPLLVLVASAATCAEDSRVADARSAREILDQTGVRGGLVVHLGCGDGKLTAALRAGESYLVHGLDADPKNVIAARRYITSQGLDGPVSVARLEGKRLPYAENSVNLVVAEDLDGVAREEVLRVLEPGGVAYLKTQGAWTKTVKARPANIDEWTHYRHDASGNAVAHDEVVGPPRHLQWSAGPPHGRSHEYSPSLYSLVSSAGRIFYVVDEAPIISIRAAPSWQLVARDAFNGQPLWKKPVGTWCPPFYRLPQSPFQLQHKLVAEGDRVYGALGLHSPVSVLDAASGQTMATFADTAGTEEIVWHQGILLLVVRSITEEKVAALRGWDQLADQENSPLHAEQTSIPQAKQWWKLEGSGPSSIVALDAQTGRQLWKRQVPAGLPLQSESLSASGQRVFYRAGRYVVCVDLESGRELWTTPTSPLRVVADGLVFCVDQDTVTALSVDNGRVQWAAPSLLYGICDVFVAGGSLWVGGEVFKSPPHGPEPLHGPYRLTQFVPRTGQMLRHIVSDNPGHHHRCYNNKATDRYILAGRRGTEFIDLQSGEILWNSWCRGVCRYGIMPANGLLYCPPHACACYMRAKLIGFNALAPESKAPLAPTPDGERLQPGPAFAEAPSNPSPVPHPPSLADWPTYRHDAARSGFTKTPVPTELKSLWRADLGGKLSSVVVADGKLYVAAVETHTVHALDASSGQALWSYTAGGRVDSPPTILRKEGRVLFGCADGCVYCLRAADGELAWQLSAAKSPQLLVVNGQLESAWPVPGSVLVQDGMAYFTAGRSSYMDGGIDLCRVEPESGKLLSRTAIYSPNPRTGQQPGELAEDTMPGSRSDILSGDDGHVYLRDAVFGPQGVALDAGKPHLFTLTGFLDDSWTHRSSWSFGTVCGSWSQHTYPLLGRQLVFNESTIYGYGPASVHWSNEFQDGPCRLFARQRDQKANLWSVKLPILVRAMLLADQMLFAAGPPSKHPPEPDKGSSALLLAVSAADGRVVAEYPLDGQPLLDGMAAAGGRLYIALEDGRVVCMAKRNGNPAGRFALPAAAGANKK
jgi:outer membrane protein assembly factor BamB